MILRVINNSSKHGFYLVNRSPWLIRDTYAQGLRDLYPNSVLTIRVADIDQIKLLRKQFAPIVINQDELHLGELIQQHFPELFI